MEDKQHITIRFGSMDLPMTVLRKDEHLYREAEKLIKERYAFYTNNYKGLQKDRYMFMTMLDIAVRLQTVVEHNDTSSLVARISPLLQEIEQALAEKK